MNTKKPCWSGNAARHLVWYFKGETILLNSTCIKSQWSKLGDLQNWKHKKNDQLNEHWSYVCEHINLMITYWMPTMEYEKKCKVQKTWIQPTNQQRQVSIKKLEVWCSQGPWCLKHYYMVSWFLEFELGLTQFLKLAQLVRIVQAL